MTLSAPGTEAFKQDFAKWEELRRQATQVLESVESTLSKKLQAKQAKDRLAAGADDKAPAGYQKQVDSYFKAIAARKKPARCTLRIRFPGGWRSCSRRRSPGGRYLEYRRPLAPLTRAQRGVLVGLRVLALAALVLFLFRPIAMLPPVGARDAIVPVLVDVSRSMRLADADGQTRIARASRAA